MTDADSISDGERLWAMVRREPAGGACPDAMDLAGYVDRRLDDARREEIEAHLAGCVPCLEAVAETRSLVCEPAPRELVDRARGLVEPRVLHWPRAAAARRRVAWPLAAAASVAVCVLGYRIGVSAFAGGPPSDAMLAEMTFGVFGAADAEGLAWEFLPMAPREDSP